MDKVTKYWENRYTQGGNSGIGSYGNEAAIKAGIINKWIDDLGIRTITEVGCGSGNNLLQYKVPISYTGYDISKTAANRCNEVTKRIKNSLKYFFTSEYNKQDFDADLLLCLDVWYYNFTDESFAVLCKNVFEDFRGKYIIIYSNDTEVQLTMDGQQLAPHVRFREVLSKVQEYPNWEVLQIITGFRTSDDKVMEFPGQKKFFLIRNKSIA